MPVLERFFSEHHTTICEWTCASIELLRQLFEIHTPLVYQSELAYDRNCTRSELVMAICRAVGADTYLSGKGASVNYLDRGRFTEEGIRIVFQDFIHPVYPQVNAKNFISGVSALDLLLNCGVEHARKLFWESTRIPEWNQINRTNDKTLATECEVKKWQTGREVET